MSIQTQALCDLMGLEILGWDLATRPSEEQVSEIAGLLYEHALLCFRDQHLTAVQLAAFGQCFGKPILHNETTLRVDGSPSVMLLSNADDRDDRQLNGGAHWHTDLVHSDNPASFTMLNAVAVPPDGGGTLFANQAAAYDALPQAKQDEYGNTTLVHCYEGRRDGSMPTFRHALVRPHPVTGRKALYGAWDTGIAVAGMTDAAADGLIKEVARHATDKKFVYLHRYRVNDLVIWDNAQLLHSGEKLKRAESAETRRIMNRVSVRGWPRPSETV